VDQALGITGAVVTSSSLSGGVIAGLVIVGIILLAIIGVTVWGFVAQRRARRGMRNDGTLPKPGRVGIRWSGVGYEVKPTNVKSWARAVTWMKGSGGNAAGQEEHGAALGPNGGKIILRESSGSLPAGGFCCILGPSGAGKSTLVDILAGKRKAGRVEGHVGYVREGSEARVTVGYVDQVSQSCSLCADSSPTCSPRHPLSLRHCCSPHNCDCRKTSLGLTRSNALIPCSVSSALSMLPILG